MHTATRPSLSPIQPRAQSRGINVSQSSHPAREEVRRLCATSYNINVSFSEDTETLNSFGHIPGLIAILCTFKKDGQVVSFGRSCSVFSRINKSIDRTVSYALNGAFLSAANNATKVFEALRVNNSPGSTSTGESGPATEKQISFLQKLLPKVQTSAEREGLETKLSNGSMTCREASEHINILLNQ